MCTKNEVGCSFIKLVTLFLPQDSVILSMAKHLKDSMEY